jgi:2-octaprenyl-6-methoxyphenol hydroxylase
MDREIRSDVIVVGAGMIGATLGIALASAGVRVTIIDRLAADTMTAGPYDGRTTAVASAARRALDALGVWPMLAADAAAIDDIRISDGRLEPGAPEARTSSLHLHFDHRELAEGRDPAQPMGHIVENRFIRRALFARLAEMPTATFLAPAETTSITRDDAAATVTLADGRILRAPLLVSAEGKFGALREQAGIGALRWRYEQIAIVCVAEHERPHKGVAHEKFLPGGPFAILPMTDDPQTGAHRSSIVWSERADLVPALLKLDDDSFAREFAQRFGSHLGAVRPVGPRYHYPLSLMHAERYVARRLALVGDAAHAIHPIAGQGWNLGLRDVVALAEVVVDARRLGLDIGGAATLEAYERWRRVDNLALVAATDALNRLFSNDLPPVRLARDLGLAAVNRVPPLRRFFMRHAMGAVGDQPRLTRGLPL